MNFIKNFIMVLLVAFVFGFVLCSMWMLKEPYNIIFGLFVLLAGIAYESEDII